MLSPRASAFISAFHDGFAGAMSCDVAKPWHIPKLNIGEEIIMSTPETVDLAPYIIIGFVFPVEGAE